MINTPLLLLFDADMFVFRACAAAETEIDWGNDLWTLHSNVADVKEAIDNMILSITDIVLQHLKYEGAYKIIMCFSSPNYFRKYILPTYKLNRQNKRKPVAYSAVVKWVEENYTCKRFDGLEADDVIGVLATNPANKAVIISGDKDMKCLPSIFYDFIHNEFYDIDTKQADYWHLYQTLVGDVTDNYKGCPKVGEVSAKKLLEKSPTWDTVVNAFAKQGLTEADALVQARVARILRYTDVDKNMKPLLWLPNDTQKDDKLMTQNG